MKKALTEVICEFYDNGLPDGIVPRDVEYVEKLRAATVIKGMRRTGKTFVTYERIGQLIKSGVPLGCIVHINFEDDRLRDLKVSDLRLIDEIHAELYPEYSKEKCWYFLDELQKVEGWETYARRIVDSKRIQLCLTGSSSKLLSEEIATEMRGRSVPIEVFPLSFAEYLRFNGILKQPPRLGFTPRLKGVLRKAIREYLERGGFPDVQDVSPRMRVAILQGYVDAVLYRDVIERHRIASTQALRYTLDCLFHNYARKLSTRNISNVLKNITISANRESISNYIDWLADAYLVYPVSVMSDSPAVKRVNPEKYYLIDTGLIRAMSVKSDSENGWLLENLVFMALRRGLNRIKYVSNSDGTEVDFHVLNMVTKKRRLIQVAWTINDQETLNREKAALEQAQKTLHIDDCVIVTWDDEAELESGIKVVPVWKWLLQENSVD
ncbi:ATP-binding protein [bacterium]|nr:ATP-binding protein [bacterium]